MRVAVVHSAYRSDQPSGENVAVRQQVAALREAGLEILEVIRSTDDEVRDPLYRAKSALRVATGFDLHTANSRLGDFAPDLVHVHNTFPNFGTRWLASMKVPVVVTVHNFRFDCANGLLYRDGKVCLECPTLGSHRAVVNRCYQGSRVASVAPAIATSGGAMRSRLLRSASAVITQSYRVQEFLLGEGFPPSRLRLIPGFVEQLQVSTAPAPSTPHFVFVGRGTPEKGLTELLDVWPEGVLLDVIGASQINGGAAANITYLGMRDRDWITSRLPGYSALVFPGRVWEGAYPLVVREALASGIPVVALEGSSAADLVRTTGVGEVYQDGNELNLRRALVAVVSRQADLRRHCREVAGNSFSVSAWTNATLGLYREVVHQLGNTSD